MAGLDVQPGHDDERERRLVWPPRSRAPRRPAARVALQAGAVADHGEVAAFGAGFADVAFHPRFGAAVERLGFGRSAAAGAAKETPPIDSGASPNPPFSAVAPWT